MQDQLNFISKSVDDATEYNLQLEVIHAAVLDAYRIGREQQKCDVKSTDSEIIVASFNNALKEWIK
jgi:hypothetical protein